MTGTQEPPRTALVLLAGGGGSRFQGPTHKLFAPFRGSTVIETAISNAVNSQRGPVIVISGAVDITTNHSAVRIVKNLQWETGQRSSLLLALDTAESLGAECVVIGLGDQPLISSSAWQRVADQPGDVVVAAYDGHRAQPVKLHRNVWNDARNLPGDADEGLKSFLKVRSELVTQVACEGSPVDIDTEEDLSRWT